MSKTIAAIVPCVVPVPTNPSLTPFIAVFPDPSRVGSNTMSINLYQTLATSEPTSLACDAVQDPTWAGYYAIINTGIYTVYASNGIKAVTAPPGSCVIMKGDSMTANGNPLFLSTYDIAANVIGTTTATFTYGTNGPASTTGTAPYSGLALWGGTWYTGNGGGESGSNTIVDGGMTYDPAKNRWYPPLSSNNTMNAHVNPETTGATLINVTVFPSGALCTGCAQLTDCIPIACPAQCTGPATCGCDPSCEVNFTTLPRYTVSSDVLTTFAQDCTKANCSVWNAGPIMRWDPDRVFGIESTTSADSTTGSEYFNPYVFSSAEVANATNNTPIGPTAAINVQIVPGFSQGMPLYILWVGPETASMTPQDIITDVCFNTAAISSGCVPFIKGLDAPSTCLPYFSPAFNELCTTQCTINPATCSTLAAQYCSTASPTSQECACVNRDTSQVKIPSPYDTAGQTLTEFKASVDDLFNVPSGFFDDDNTICWWSPCLLGSALLSSSCDINPLTDCISALKNVIIEKSSDVVISQNCVGAPGGGALCRKDGTDPQIGCPGFYPPYCTATQPGCPGYQNNQCPSTLKGCPGYKAPKAPTPFYFWPIAGILIAIVAFFILAIILGAVLKPGSKAAAIKS